MKKQSLYPLLIVLLLFSSTVLSQHNVNDLVRKPPSATKKTLPATPTTSQLLLDIQKATSVEKKTGLLYDVAAAYLNVLKVDSALYYAQRIKTLSDSAGYEEGLGKFHLATAGACFLRSKGKEVHQHLQQAITIFTRYKKNLLLGLCYRLMARQAGNENNNEAAQQSYRMAIHLIKQAGDEIFLQRALYEFGRNFYFSYETDSAVIYLSQSLTMAEQMQNPAKTFTAAAMLGAVHLLAQNLNDAETYLKYALSLQAHGSDKVQLRSVWANYTELLLLQHRYTDAENALKEHNKLTAIMGDATGKMNNQKLSGILFYQQGKYKEALQHLRQAYSFQKELGAQNFDLKVIAMHLAQAEMKAGNVDSAIAHLQHAKQVADIFNFPFSEMEVYMLLAQAYQQKQNADSAYHYFRQYSFMKDSLMSIQKEKTVLEITARYDAEKKEQQITSLQNEKQLFSYQLQLKNKTIEGQRLQDEQKSQQLALLTQQQEISRLQASEKNLALQNSEKEFVKKQNELVLLQKEKELQTALTTKESQQKNLLFAIIALILLVSIYGVYRYRQAENFRRQLAQSLVELKEAQELLVKTETEKEAENVRLRISRDIHDEVGATLSGVALFSEIARQKIEQHKQQDAGEYLKHISDNSKEMVEKMSDIVWAINPKNDSFERLILKLQSYAMNLCAGREIQLHFEMEESLRRIRPPMQDRKNIHLIAKEALNNAVKYSEAKNIFFFMRTSADVVTVEIKDDGKGFVWQDDEQGNGLANMKTRAAELGSDLMIDSTPGAGTVIRLQFHFHPNGVQV